VTPSSAIAALSSATVICLLPNCCFLSETSRMIEIHRALEARGAAVCVATHGGTYEWALRDTGIAYDVIGPGMSPERCAAFVRSVPGIGPTDQSMWSDEELRTYAELEHAYFVEHGVAVAVTGWTLTTLLSTRLAGIPLVTDHAGSFVPPVFERGLLPLPQVRLGLPLERWLPRRLRRRLYNAGATRLTIYTHGFNRVADELGVEGVPSFGALLLGDLTLVTDVPEVLGVSREDVDEWEPKESGRYRDGVRCMYVGPIYAHLALPVPERVERFLAEPAVYVGITSSTADIVRDVVGALRELDVRLLVAATVHDLGDLEEDGRVLVDRVLPSHEIMPRVQLAVISGGQGSMQTALASGTPFVGIPLQPEQHANVALVERQGAARLALDPADAARAVRELLDDDRFRDNARRLQTAFAAVDGPGAAADAILGLG
jgi:UDP:flavonoid glycosyltransferase YjiC (YdhE family)